MASRCIAIVVAFAAAVSAQTELLNLDLTVDGQGTKLLLLEGQSYLDAARRACSPVFEPLAIDNCVGGAMTIIVDQHLRAKEAEGSTLASPGVSLVRDGSVENYDPVSWVGASPLHVDIELPVRTQRTVCDNAKCWELGDDDGVPVANHTLQVPAWTANTSQAAREVAAALDLWREADLALIEHRVALERTRKSTPVDARLHRAVGDAPVVSFDGFYPVYFVLHTSNLFFDAQRVKVSGAFRPPTDGDVCISVHSSGKEGANGDADAAGASVVTGDLASRPKPAEACFDTSYNAQLSGFADAQGSHRLEVRLRRRATDATVGEGDASTFVAAPQLQPKTPLNTPAGRFIKLLRDAVVGWLYLDGVDADDGPGVAGPLSPNWVGHTMVGVHKLDWLQAMIEGLVEDGVPGDIVECGAWRGGASIFSKGVVDVLDPTGGRKIFVADTFVGFPQADIENDGVDTNGWAYQNFHVGGADAVVATFKRYGVFDDKVVIAGGLFNETLPILPTTQIALLRMDCDMYRSTTQALDLLYDKVTVGGIVVHNNWQYTSARAAVIDFRRNRNMRYGAGYAYPTHVDCYENVIFQLAGRKNVTIFPPDVVWDTKPDVENKHWPRGGDDDLRRARRSAVSVELGPGDALYVPLMWPHNVDSDEFSVTANAYLRLGDDADWGDYVDRSKTNAWLAYEIATGTRLC
jgi:hypothetical protein